MSENTSSTTQQAGTVTYQVPLNVTVDLDTDEEFRGFTTEERTQAITLLTRSVVRLVSTPRVTFSADGTAVEVAA